MQRTPEQQTKIKRAAITIIAGFMIWLAASWLGGALGLPPIFALALDFLVILAFIWALYTLWQLLNE